jgi:DNA helicase HerA-like ATPase
VNLMRAKRHDVRYSFLFGEHSQDCLNRLINRFMGGDKPVKNIDLSGVPHDVAIPVIGAVTKLVFDIQRGMGSGFCPITLACDEAHIYIPNNFQLSASERRMVEVFENIAKEGRKFGLTLLVASQRPSELNKTIMAQCANFIVGKLNNENDKAMIKAMLPSGSESVIDSTAMFSPGDVLVVGDAAPIPLKIHVELARERPRSRTIDFWDEWSGSERVSDYSEQVERYLED